MHTVVHPSIELPLSYSGCARPFRLKIKVQSIGLAARCFPHPLMLSTPYKQVLSWVIEHYAEAIHNVQRQKNMSISDLAKMVRIDEWTMEDM